MSDRTYGVTEIVGTSEDSIEQAIRNALARAAKTVRNVDWFEATEFRGHVSEGEVQHFQVTLKIGFRIEDSD